MKVAPSVVTGLIERFGATAGKFRDPFLVELSRVREESLRGALPEGFRDVDAGGFAVGVASAQGVVSKASPAVKPTDILAMRRLRAALDREAEATDKAIVRMKEGPDAPSDHSESVKRLRGRAAGLRYVASQLVTRFDLEELVKELSARAGSWAGNPNEPYAAEISKGIRQASDVLRACLAGSRSPSHALEKARNLMRAVLIETRAAEATSQRDLLLARSLRGDHQRHEAEVLSLKSFRWGLEFGYSQLR
jgi:hypothetical protein